MVWTAYYRLSVMCSNGAISDILFDTFGYDISRGLVQHFKCDMADYYTPLHQRLCDELKQGRLVHADETKINMRVGDAYVWVLTNLTSVVYIYSDTREGSLLDEILEGFEGVLVSDFYSAYDRVACPQQKCLIHLIRDINDDLFKNQFDTELRELGSAFGDVLTAIVETIDQHGLQKKHLRAHKPQVTRFLHDVIARDCTSDVARSYQNRIQKYRDKLFTFLNHDGVPWNNNNAEHMVKRFAYLRRGIGGFSTPKGIQEFLVLLSVVETLKLRGIDPLSFLMSGSLDMP